MADRLVERFVELHSKTEQLLGEENLKEAKETYLEAAHVYQSISHSKLERFHKELAYDQLTILFKKLQTTKEKIKVPYNLIAAAALVIAFSFLILFNPSIVGLASLEDAVRQPVNIQFIESGIEEVTLRDRPLSLLASGNFTGKAKLYYKSGQKLELIFDSEISTSENGTFKDVCEETCSLNSKSNNIELFAQIENGTLNLNELSYKIQAKDNTAPAWTGKTRKFTAETGETTTIDLSELFTDAENDQLVFLSTTTEGYT